MKRYTGIIVTFITLIIVGAGVVWFLDSEAEERGGRPPTAVEVIAVARQPIADKIEVLGSSYANESITLTANVTETIAEIAFEDGQRVDAGDVIVILEQSEEQAQLKAAELQLAEHQRELGRLKRLLANKAASKRSYDERKTLRDITRQQVAEIQARIKDRTITAPFSGYLGIRQVSVGGLVRPGDAITTLEDSSQIKLDFEVPEVYLPRLVAGLPVVATNDAFVDLKFEGLVATVNNRVDPVTRSILVRAIIDNPDLI